MSGGSPQGGRTEPKRCIEASAIWKAISTSVGDSFFTVGPSLVTNDPLKAGDLH